MKRIKMYTNREWRLWFLLAAGVVLLGVMAVLQARELPRLDRRVSAAVTAWQVPWLTSFFTAVTLFADWRWMTALGLGSLLVARPWYRGLGFGAVALLAGGSNQLLKLIFGRQRPEEQGMLVSAGGYSFPSGHAMMAAAVYGLLIWAVWRTAWPLCRKTGITAALLVWIALIGLSRVYLGVHYTSDVLAGFGGGMAVLAVSLLAFRFFPRQKGKGSHPL